MTQWVEAGVRAILKKAVQNGMAAKGVYPKLDGIPLDLLVNIAFCDYRNEVDAVIRMFLETAARKDKSNDLEDLNDAMLLREQVEHVKMHMRVEEQKNAKR